ncbi:outer-membrane immunogenic protein [Methylocystis bryophila]|nr:outer-membrane immunogenic protein [Methylocystis bryophila]
MKTIRYLFAALQARPCRNDAANVMRKLALAASLALGLVGGSAFAAGVPSLNAPIIVPPPVFSWTGLYGGVNIGYGFGNNNQDPGGLVYERFLCCIVPGSAWSIPDDPRGVLGGGQAGYNHQFNPWLVVGIEADTQATDVHSQGNGINGAPGVGAIGTGPHFAFASQNKSVDWFGTVRGRIGVTIPNLPNLLLYGTGGLAYGGVVQSVNVSDFFPELPGVIVGAGTNYDKTKVGWTAGGGVEWFPAPAHSLFHAFSIKLEYLYTDLGPTTLYGTSILVLTSPPGPGPTFFYSQTSPTRWHTVRMGVNWHFNPFAPDPVIAKY